MSLQLKLGQQLTMTPQLQQAIKLLQLSTLDLQQEIHEALESNPMLELIEEGFNDDNAQKDQDKDKNSGDAQKEKSQSNEEVPDASNLDLDESNWREDSKDEHPVDSNWDDVYTTNYSVSTGSGSDNDLPDFESRNSSEETLQDHLLWQLNLTPMSEQDHDIALAIVDAIDINGMLTVDLESIRSGFDPALEIEEDEVLAVLHRIQQFDPIGVGYRDLAECLLLQLSQISQGNEPSNDAPSDDNLTKVIGNARKVITEHLSLLGNHDYAQLMRRTRLKEPELKAAITLIESLNPRPGADIAPPAATYIVPDVIVTKNPKTGKWLVELNPDTAPKIRINDSYASLVKQPNSADDKNFLRDNLQEARWFIKSLQSRNETLMKVATRIVEHQRGFLEYGEEAMKPLVLHDIAEAVSMHESTISRVTTQKYMHTPRGILELKYFFSSHVSTSDGGECSSTAIRAIIRKLIDAENLQKPLSDSKIAKVLEERGINVARRTIAKYRESLSIPPSNERKRLSD